jgi:hypothetical protein
VQKAAVSVNGFTETEGGGRYYDTFTSSSYAKQHEGDEKCVKTNRRERDTYTPLAPNVQIHQLIRRTGILLLLFLRRLQMLWDSYGQRAPWSNTKRILPPPYKLL